MSCPYAHALGVPGQGVHAQRFLGIALNDTLMTIAGGILIAFIFDIAIWKAVLGFFVLGEILHYVFGTQTAFLKMIGMSPHCT